MAQTRAAPPRRPAAAGTATVRLTQDVYYAGNVTGAIPQEQPGPRSPTATLLEQVNRDVPDVIPDVSPGERAHEMNTGGDLAGYLSTGQWALKRIRLALLGAQKTSVASILDLPCGHGRFLRMLKAEFPHAKLTAADIDHEGVDFCARTFGAVPVYSALDPAETEIAGPFDLIWCASLFTHMNRDGWERFLRFFESQLAVGGVLIFTTLGRFAAEELCRPRLNSFGLTDAQLDNVLAAYDDSGFGYSNYAFEAEESLSLPAEYGISIASASWVCGLLERETPWLDLLSYTQAGFGRRWGRVRPANGLNDQDVVACIRADNQVRASG
jgi:SAM-dependent methyltransferase